MEQEAHVWLLHVDRGHREHLHGIWNFTKTIHLVSLHWGGGGGVVKAQLKEGTQVSCSGKETQPDAVLCRPREVLPLDTLLSPQPI